MKKKSFVYLVMVVTLLMAARYFNADKKTPQPKSQQVSEVLQSKNLRHWTPRVRRSGNDSRSYENTNTQIKVKIPKERAFRTAVDSLNGTGVIINLKNLRDSSFFQTALECFMSDVDGVMAEIQDELGVDPMRDLDSVAVYEDGIVLSGDLQYWSTDRELEADGSYRLRSAKAPNGQELTMIGDGLAVVSDDSMLSHSILKGVQYQQHIEYDSEGEHEFPDVQLALAGDILQRFNKNIAPENQVTEALIAANFVGPVMAMNSEISTQSDKGAELVARMLGGAGSKLKQSFRKINPEAADLLSQLELTYHGRRVTFNAAIDEEGFKNSELCFTKAKNQDGARDEMGKNN